MTQSLYSTSGFDPATSLVSGLGERSPLSFVGGQAMWRLQKKQASLAKYGLKARYAQSQRAASQFKETSERNRQGLQQSLAARGLGTSSIATQDTGAFERQTARTAASLAEQQEMARRQLSNYRKQRKFARRMGPINFIDAIQAKGMQAIMMIMGLPGGAGGAGMSGSTGPSFGAPEMSPYGNPFVD